MLTHSTIVGGQYINFLSPFPEGLGSCLCMKSQTMHDPFTSSHGHHTHPFMENHFN